jgi:hypothetical protein
MDEISYTQVRDLLEGGMSLLSPIQRSIVTSFFLWDKPVTQKSFLAEHQIKKDRLDIERENAISALRCWLISHRITGMYDIE